MIKGVSVTSLLSMYEPRIVGKKRGRDAVRYLSPLVQN
jgi:hypothetical protein